MGTINTYKQARAYFRRAGYSLLQVKNMAGRKTAFTKKNMTLIYFARFHQSMMEDMKNKLEKWEASKPTILDIKHK